MKEIYHPYHTRQNMLARDYEIFHYSSRDLEIVNLHHHDFYECYLFLSGDITYLIEGKSYPLKAGDIVLVNSRELHQAIIHSNSVPYERVVLWLDKDFVQSLSSEKTNLLKCFEDENRENVIRANFEDQQNLKLLFEKIINLESYKGIGYDLLYKAYITELLAYFNTLVFSSKEKSFIEIKKSSLINGIIQYINAHLDEDINIDSLAEKFFISKFHMLREFKKHSGITIHKFIIHKKLILAKELILLETPILDVYKQCGFGDYSNFFRAFKNEFGVTPKSFLKLMTDNK